LIPIPEWKLAHKIKEDKLGNKTGTGTLLIPMDKMAQLNMF
jgi:hypothetical protein